MLSRIGAYASFVRFSHTVFALPFALSGALLASQETSLTWERVVLIIFAMGAARTAAMSFNRIVDARFDSKNPRTMNRELPRGIIKRREAVIVVVASSLVFVFVCFMLSPICFWLSPVALGIVFWYSLAKRFTNYTQLFLGLAMAVAPVGGWLAVSGKFSLVPGLLALGIATWVAGFDILYACEDIDFDRRYGLRSIPARFGIAPSLKISRLLHVVTVLSLTSVALVITLAPLYYLGMLGVTALLMYEQSMVRIDDLSRIKEAFDLNGWVGILYLLTTAAGLYGV